MRSGSASLLPFAWLVGALLPLGCASTELKGRDILRLGPLRGAAVHPHGAFDEPLPLAARPDALTDEEIDALSRRLSARFDERVRARAKELAPGSAALGTARVHRCALRASAGRRNTVYEARCWVALEVDGVVVVEVESRATRFAPPRAVSEAEAARIRTLPRNPLLSVADSEAALLSALDHAAVLLVAAPALDDAGAPPGDASRDPALDEALVRRAALTRAEQEGERERLAASADLARWGRPEDAPALLPLLDDKRPRVRQAAATALAELASPASYAALYRRRNDSDPGARAAIELALSRLRALYPDLREPDTAGPSNSSTTGGGRSGEMPRSFR